tara:strand:+ start:1328 stop:2515 length:1188 start_codon:yes stop_codon:yes gene_type:complete
MASTYSDLKIELIATGEQSGSWGTTTNTNLGTAIQEAITGRAAADFSSDADLTLGYTNSNATQTFRNLILNVTSSVSLTTTRNLVVPTIDKLYIIENNTTGSQSIVVKTSAGTGITVPNGTTAVVYADSTNVVTLMDYIPSLEIDTVNIDGGAIDAVTLGTNSAVTEAQIDNLNINGNTISSTDSNGNIAITPDGVGEVDISKVDIDGGAIDAVTLGTNSAVTEAQIDNININGNAITSTDSNGNIAITPDGVGEVDISKVDIDGGAIDGTTIGANAAAAGTFTTVTDDDGALRAIPQSGSAKTTSYSLQTSDVGNFIEVGSGGSITIPDATFSAGDAVSIFNNTTGNITITCSITTAYIAGTNTDQSSVTLGTRGVATILFISGTVCVITGNVV